MNNFSPNMLKTFDECQMKFFFKYIEKISVPQRAKLFEKGKKVHALANYYLKGSDISKMEKVLNLDERAAWEALKASEYFKLKVVNTEYNLSCKVDKYWIGGRLDALMCSEAYAGGVGTSPYDPKASGAGENTNDSTIQPFNFSTAGYFILDYKTGRIPQNAEWDFQTIVYLLSVDKFLKTKKIPCESLKFVYLGLKDNAEKSILLDDNLKKEYEEKVTALCQKIDLAVTSAVFSKNKKNCKSCEYDKFCNL